MKGSKERVGVLKAQQEGGFIQFHRALSQVITGKFAAGLLNELLKGEARVREPALKRAGAKSQFPGDILEGGTLAGQ